MFGATFSLELLPDDLSAGTESATLSLADRFDTVLDAGRRIASALSPEAAYSAVQETTLKLLRGEECHVLRMHPDGDESISPGRPVGRRLLPRHGPSSHGDIPGRRQRRGGDRPCR